jgi:hypothetical protein
VLHYNALEFPATYITNIENIDSLEEFQLLSKDDVETLCQMIRNPGGLVNNPNAGVAGQPQQIQNPGRHVKQSEKLSMQ